MAWRQDRRDIKNRQAQQFDIHDFPDAFEEPNVTGL